MQVSDLLKAAIKDQYINDVSLFESSLKIEPLIDIF